MNSELYHGYFNQYVTIDIVNQYGIVYIFEKYLKVIPKIGYYLLTYRYADSGVTYENYICKITSINNSIGGTYILVDNLPKNFLFFSLLFAGENIDAVIYTPTIFIATDVDIRGYMKYNFNMNNNFNAIMYTSQNFEDIYPNGTIISSDKNLGYLYIYDNSVSSDPVYGKWVLMFTTLTNYIFDDTVSSSSYLVYNSGSENNYYVNINTSINYNTTFSGIYTTNNIDDVNYGSNPLYILQDSIKFYDSGSDIQNYSELGCYGNIYYYDGNSKELLTIDSNLISFTDTTTDIVYTVKNSGNINYNINYTVDPIYIFYGIIVNDIPTQPPIIGQEYQLVNNSIAGGRGHIYYYDDNNWQIYSSAGDIFFTDIITNTIYYVTNIGSENFNVEIYIEPKFTLYNGIYNEELITTPLNDINNFPIMLIYTQIFILYPKVGDIILIRYYNVYYAIQVTNIEGNGKFVLIDYLPSKFLFYANDENIYLVSNVYNRNGVTQYSTYDNENTNFIGEKPLTLNIDIDKTIISYDNIKSKNYGFLFIVDNDVDPTNMYGYNLFMFTTLKSYTFNDIPASTNYLVYNTGYENYIYLIIQDLGDEIIEGTTITTNDINSIQEYDDEYILQNSHELGGFGNVYYANEYYKFLCNTLTKIFFNTPNNNYFVNNVGEYNYKIYEIVDTNDLYFNGVISENNPNGKPNIGDEYQLVDNSNIGGYANIYHYINDDWVMLNTISQNIYFNNFIIINVGQENYSLNEIIYTPSTYTGYYGIKSNTNKNNYDILKFLKGDNPVVGDYLLLKDDIFRLFKYIGNESLSIIDIPTNFIFYSNNGDFINTFSPSILLISSNISSNIGSFDPLLTNNFSGSIGENDPTNAISSDLDKYYLNTISGGLFKCVYTQSLYIWCKIFNTLTRNIYFGVNGEYINKYIIYTYPTDVYTLVEEINFVTEEYKGYQGYFIDTIVDDVISKIIELKGNRPIINGDTLLSKNVNNKYIIYVINDASTSSYSTIPIFSHYYVFNDLLLLQVLKVNQDQVIFLNNFDQHLYSFIGLTGNVIPDINVIGDYYMSLEDNNLYININNEWLVNYKGLYKFNYNSMLSYSSYINLYIYSILNESVDDNIYRGFYNPTKTMTSKNDIRVLEILQNYKHSFINIYDILLVNINNTYSSCTINIISNELIITYNDNLNNITFLNIANGIIRSQHIEYNTLSPIQFTHNINEPYIGLITNNVFPQGNIGDFLINELDNKIYQCVDINSWVVSYFNVFTIEYIYNNILYSVNININGEVTSMNSITTLFNGYYIESNDVNYYNMLYNIKSIKPKIGDYLLVHSLSNNTILLQKYTNDTENNSGFSQIIINSDYYIFYSNIDEHYMIIKNIDTKQVNVFDNDILFEGLYGNSQPSNANINNVGKTYLNTSNGNLYLCYNYYENNYMWIPIITTLSKNKYIATNDGNNTNPNVIYILYIKPNLTIPDSPIIINFSDSEYQGYQGFILDNDDDVINDIIKLKGGKNVINGDTILLYSDNKYNIYIIIDNVVTLSKELNNDFILFYDIANLQIVKYNMNGKNNLLLNGVYLDYFDQTKYTIDGYFSVSYPTMFDDKSLEYLCFADNNIYIYDGYSWLKTFKSLYKYNYNHYDIHLLGYVKYNNLQNILINKDLIDINMFQGYYNINTILQIPTNNLQTQLNVVEVIQNLNGYYVNIEDTLLFKTSNDVYVSVVNLNPNLNVISNIVTNSAFLNVDDYEISSQNIIGNNITQLNYSLDMLANNLYGYIGNYANNIFPSNNYIEGDLLLNTNNNVQQKLFQFNGNDWFPLLTNNKFLYFTDNINLYTINTNLLTNNTIIKNITSSKPLYQGYFSNDEINEYNYEVITNIIKELNGLNTIFAGDALIIKSRSTNKFIICVISNNQNLDIDYYPITETILFYCNNSFDEYKSKILTINESSFSVGSTFDNKKNIFDGIAIHGTPITAPSITNTFCLNIDLFLLYTYNQSWYKTITNCYNFKYKYDGNTVNVTTVFSSNPLIGNSNGVIYNDVNDKQNYEGNYQAYYSIDNLTTSSNIYVDVINSLLSVKKSPVLIGDFILVKIDGILKILRIEVLQPPYVNQINIDSSEYLYYNLAGPNIYYINKANNTATLTNLIFDPSIKEFYGYMEPVVIIKDRNYNIELEANKFTQLYNGEYIYAFLGLYKYNYSVNPFFTVFNLYTSGTTVLNTLMANSSAGIDNIIVFDDVEIFTGNDLPTNRDLGTILYLDSNKYYGGVVIYSNVVISGVTTQMWCYYRVLPTLKLNIINDPKSQYLINSGNSQYFTTYDATFSGYLVDTLPDINDYNLGDLILLKTDAKVYELSYNTDDNIYLDYQWDELCDEQCYFFDINKNITYIANNVGLPSAYVFEKSLTSYYIGKIIDSSFTNYVDGEYYALTYEPNICLYKNNQLNIISKNNTPYQIYNIDNNEIFVFNGQYFGLKEYGGYSFKVDDLENPVLPNYKDTNYILIYENVLDINTNVKLYNKNIPIKLLNKTYYNDKLKGKSYMIELIDEYEGKIIEILKSKLNNAIITKYINNNFNNLNKSINLLSNTSRIIKQVIYDETGYIKFIEQPPKTAKHVVNNYSNKCSIILFNDYWYFDSSKVGNISINFEYSESGLIYELLYIIHRDSEIIRQITISSFTGNFNFVGLPETKYALMNVDIYRIFTFVNNDYLTNGIFTVPSSGLYNIKIVINYKYNSSVTNFELDETPYYSINYYDNLIIGQEIVKSKIPITNVNIPQSNIYYPITNSSVNISSILELEKDKKLVIVYNLSNYQVNVNYDISYINIIKLN